MTAHIRKDGSSKNVDDIYTKVDGTWHLVLEGYVKVNGAWKEFYRVPPGKPTINSITDQGAGRPYNDGLISVAFSLPPGSQPATSYTVKATAPGQSQLTITGASSPLQISGLASGLTYSVTVTAINSTYGTSGESNPYNIIPTTVPATPSSPGASPNVDSDSVSWVAPATGGKTITNYNWESNDGKSGYTAATSITITQEGSTSQAYRVRAYTDNGWGPWSGWSGTITTTPPYFPYFPYFPWFPPWFPWFPPWFPYFPYFPWFPWFPPYFRAGCIEADTKILTTNGLVSAKDIKVGDKVVTYEINEKAPTTDAGTLFMWDAQSLTVSNTPTETEVVRVVEKGDSAIIYFNGDIESKYSITQPLFIKSADGSYKIRTTGSLEIGDFIVKINNDGTTTEEEITDITIEEDLGMVYQIDCEPIQWFVAGGYLAHNK